MRHALNIPVRFRNWQARQFDLELIVDDKLRDKLSLQSIAFVRSTGPEEPPSVRTKPNMYTKDVNVEMMKLYHPLCVSYIRE